MKTLTLLFTLLLVSACHHKSKPTITADYRYSNSGGFGTQNAGFLTPGQLFVWNIAENTLERVEVLPLKLSSGNSNNVAGDQSSTGVAGVSVSGIPSTLTGQERLLEASIGAKSTFTIKNTTREDYTGAITALRDYVRALVADGENADLVFYPRDNNFRVVIINSVLRAQSSQLSIGGVDASDPSKVAGVTLNSPVGDIASINVRASSKTTCGNTNENVEKLPACFFNVLIRDPHYVEGKTGMQFRVFSWPVDNLPAAFRKLR